MQENNRFRYSNFNQVFGELQSLHPIERSKAEVIFIPLIIFLVFLFGVITYISSKDVWTIPICVLPFFLMFCGVVWELFSTRGDELRIYQNGFTYKSRKTQACLWTEIKTCRSCERNYREISEMGFENIPLSSVEKENGEVIRFSHSVPGTEKIANRQTRR